MQKRNAEEEHWLQTSIPLQHSSSAFRVSSSYLNNAADFETTCPTPHTAGISTTNQASATFTRSPMCGPLPLM